MSEYYDFEGLGDPGDEPGADPETFLADAPDFGFEYDAADVHSAHDGYGAHDGDGPELADAYADADADTLEGAEPVDAGTYDSVLDGLDLEFDNVDFASLIDTAFDAAYDLIGSDPDENGWWDALASENSHDGAYDEVSYDLDTNPYVTH